MQSRTSCRKNQLRILSCGAVLSAALFCGPQAGAVQFGLYDYYLSAGFTTWQDAENQAVAAGGHLASVHSLAEQAFLLSNFGSFRWIGLNDLATEGTFVWTDGTPLDYTSWDAGEPNNQLNEDVVWTVPGGVWNDKTADTIAQGIIKVRIPSVPDGGSALGMLSIAMAAMVALRRKLR
jgi:hypothetical protein